MSNPPKGWLGWLLSPIQLSAPLILNRKTHLRPSPVFACVVLDFLSLPQVKGSVFSVNFYVLGTRSDAGLGYFRTSLRGSHLLGGLGGWGWGGLARSR